MEKQTYNLLEEWYTSEITNSLFEVANEYEYNKYFDKDDLREIIKELEYTVTAGGGDYYRKERNLYENVLLALCENNDLESKIFD